MTSGIIIRLQNLPWTANAEDIRRFFDSLTIPDGGVHIIGGERGDAFIVFGSDEDARQAMLKDGGIIKDTPIKLLLSSRTEMQKVIEAAKQQAATQAAAPAITQNFLQTLAAATQQFNPALQMPMIPQLMSMFPALRNFAAGGMPAMPMAGMPNMPGMAGMPNMPGMAGMPNLPAIAGMPTIPPFPSIPGMPGMPMTMPNNMMPGVNATNGDKSALPAGMPGMTSLAPANDKSTPAVTSIAPVIHTNMVMNHQQHPHPANEKVGPSNQQQRVKIEPKSGAASANQAEKERKRSGSRSRSRSRSRERRRDRYGRDAKRDRSRERRSRRSRSRDRYRRRSDSKERTSRDADRARDRNATNTKDRRGSDSLKTEPRKTSSEKDSKIKRAVGRDLDDFMPCTKVAQREGTNGRDVIAAPVTRNYETNKEEVYGDAESRKPAANRYEGGPYNNRRYGRNSYDEENVGYGSSDNTSYPRKNAYKPGYNQSASDFNYTAPAGFNNDDDMPSAVNSHAPYAAAPNSYAYNSHSTCVELSNVPWTTTEPDVRKFFAPIPVFDESIKFRSSQFNRERTVLVKFVNTEQKRQALLKNGNTISGQHVVVADVPMNVWEMTEKSATIIPRPQEPYVRINFIPKRASRDAISAIFARPPVKLIVSKVKNRESLVAYAECASLDDVQKLLKNKANALIGESRVKVEPINEADFQAGQRDVIDPNSPDDEEETTPSYSIEYPPKRPRLDQAPSYPINDRYHYRRPLQPPKSGSSSPVLLIKSTCCLVKNLPSSVTDKEIVDFFADTNVLPTQIHIMFNADYKQTGESYCEFRSEADAETALCMNGKVLRGRVVTIVLIPTEEVTKAIGVPKLTPMLPHDSVTDGTPKDGKVDGETKPAETRDGEKEEINEEEAENTTADDRSSKLPSLFSQPVKLPHAVKSGPYNNDYPKPVYRGRPAPPYTPRHPRRPPPGSVVMLENVPYRAEVEEILDFFGDFNISEEQVLRRYNEYDMPTGDCRVTLRNSYEAQQAVRNLNGCMIGRRTITVSLAYE